MITVEVVLDSVSPAGKRLTTMRLRYPKFIHGEFMTHRVLSRNASSSRAVPVARSIEEVRSNALRAAPVRWPAERKGMQGGKELDDVEYRNLIYGALGQYTTDLRYAWHLWRHAALAAADAAERMVAVGLHKSVVNRILEPFLHINVVVTATEWDNFFGLRCHPDAQPEMRALAEAMREAQRASKPVELSPGEWHLPFVDGRDHLAIAKEHADDKTREERLVIARRVSVARCARVSYESHETGRRSTVEEDLRLFDRLAASGHWSPFEHQATPDEWVETFGVEEEGPDRWANPDEHGNLVGWRQLRKTMPGESVRQTNGEES